VTSQLSAAQRELRSTQLTLHQTRQELTDSHAEHEQLLTALKRTHATALSRTETERNELVAQVARLTAQLSSVQQRAAEEERKAREWSKSELSKVEKTVAQYVFV
jgi:hypothetical protein